jgi:hypothetical protein
LPAQYPAISPRALTASVSSASGTFQRLSARTRIGIPWPATRHPGALKNSSGRSAS